MAISELIDRQFERILIIKPSALGDVIHTVPVLVKLRQRYPLAQIDWMLQPAIADWVAHHPALNRVVKFDRQALANPLTTLPTVWRLLADLRRGHYDLVIDLQGQFRSGLLAMATRAPVRIGFDRPRKEVRTSQRQLPAAAYKHGWSGAREKSWLAYSHHILIPTLDAHAVDRYLRLGDMLGFAADAPDFHLPIPPTAVARVDQLLKEHGVGDRRLLVLSPGTVWDTKRWHTGGFAAVADHFIEQGWSVALVGSRADAGVCRQITSLCQGAVNLSGQTSISELAALLCRADLCITNDSGPMHMAVALDRPVVAIFGPTDPLWIGPYGRPEAVVRLALPCSPCYLRSVRRCPHDHACMHDLKPQDVIDCANRILNGAAARPLQAGAGL